jgi:hypothetical protein
MRPAVALLLLRPASFRLPRHSDVAEPEQHETGLSTGENGGEKSVQTTEIEPELG